MANNLSIFSGGAMTLSKQDMASALRGASQGVLPGDGVYMSFSGKLGTYSVGQDKNEVDPEHVWIVNIAEIQIGYICWKGGAPAAKRMMSAYSNTQLEVNFEEHGPFNAAKGEGWFEAHQLMLRNVDDGVQAVFTTNSKSGVNEFRKLEREIANRLETDQPAWPCIKLLRESFVAQGQKNFKPKIEIVGWLTVEDIQELASVEPERWAEHVTDMLSGNAGLGEDSDESLEDEDVFATPKKADEAPAKSAAPAAKPTTSLQRPGLPARPGKPK